MYCLLSLQTLSSVLPYSYFMSTHFENGKAIMVDISAKQDSAREAIAEAFVELPEEAVSQLKSATAKKGDAIAVAELAGIMAAKKTSELIPLCHPLPLTKVQVKGDLEATGVRFNALCKTTGKTGVEMEAMTAASIAALTLYDMLKSVTKGITIKEVKLLSKEGGKSGLWQRTS